MQSLKQKTLSSLQNMLFHLENQSQQHQNKESNDNPENDHNQQESNNQVTEMKLSELIDRFGDQLEAQQKMLIQIAYQNQANTLLSWRDFAQKLRESIKKIQSQNHNQFQSIRDNPFKEPEMSKTLKLKPRKQQRHPAQKTEPTVQSHPEYYRVDNQLTHKLFIHYSNLPIGISKAALSVSFEQKQHYKNSLNYHKILEMFKDSRITLQINQKLFILRSVKKFAFNQNMIIEGQFIKIFKVIVHGLGYKQKLFQDLILKKAIDGSLYGQKKKRKSQSQSKPHKIYRFKTQSNLMDNSATNIRQGNTNINLANLNNIHNFNSHNQQDNNSTFQRSRITSHHLIVNQGRVGHQSQVKGNKQHVGKKLGTIREMRSGSSGSYLLKAMDSQKISKITWQSLFAMKQNNMHFNIVIPDIARGLDQLQNY